MAAERVLRGVLREPGANRHQVDVTDQLQQIRIRIDEQRVITLLEQMARFAVLAVHAARVLTREPLHEPADRHIGNLHCEIYGVGRPAERVQLCPATREHGREQLLERRIVASIGENRLTRVTALNDVVQPAWNMKSGSTRHPCPPYPLSVCDPHVSASFNP